MSATVHHVHAPIIVAGCGELIVTDGRPVALCFGANAEPVARRLAELLDRHGLADIPDTPAGIAGWPAPDPTTRKTTP